MSTKAQIVSNIRELIRKREATDDDQRTLHYKRVESLVGYAFDTLLSQIQMEDDGEYEIESYFVKHYYNQSVLQSNGYRYVGLTDEIVPLDGGRGVWYVQPSGGSSVMNRFKRPTLNRYRSLPFGAAINETMYRVGNVSSDSRWQIILEDIGSSVLTDIRKVDYGVVRAFASYGEDEEIRMPDGRYDLLIQMCLSAAGQRESNNVNDNI